MPEIRIADEAGACYGVERALQMVENAAWRPNDELDATAKSVLLGLERSASKARVNAPEYQYRQTERRRGATMRICSSICCASSRVGDRTRQRGARLRRGGVSPNL